MRIVALFTYRLLARLIFFVWADPRRGVRGHSSEYGVLSRAALPEGPVDYWFHVASAGEVESLAPVILESMARGERGVISFFSASAERALERLLQEVPQGSLAPGAWSVGFSPREGDWEPVLRKVHPRCWVTAKYEAWPDIWSSCVRLGLPIVVVGALDRSAFHVSARLTRLFTRALPRLCLAPFLPEDARGLERFRIEAGAVVREAVDPRWDRVRARAGRTHERAELIWSWVRARGHAPYGVLAQVWREDLLVWSPYLRAFPGTWVVFPHVVSPEAVEDLAQALGALGYRVWRTSRLVDLPETVPHGLPEIWLVDEVGFLAEFYAHADFVYVGGGFGAGLHSTIEPALYGLPIVAGRARADKFSEVGLLVRTGQLRLIGTPGEIQQVLEDQPWAVGPEQRARWKKGIPSFGVGTGSVRALLESWS